MVLEKANETLLYASDAAEKFSDRYAIGYLSLVYFLSLKCYPSYHEKLKIMQIFFFFFGGEGVARKHFLFSLLITKMSHCFHFFFLPVLKNLYRKQGKQKTIKSFYCFLYKILSIGNKVKNCGIVVIKSKNRQCFLKPNGP